MTNFSLTLSDIVAWVLHDMVDDACHESVDPYHNKYPILISLKQKLTEDNEEYIFEQVWESIEKSINTIGEKILLKGDYDK